MQAICQLDVQGAASFDFVGEFFLENEEDAKIRQMAMIWTKGVWANIAECDKLIKQAALKWEMSRLSLVDKGILRLSVYHLKYCADIPPKVVINEAIELAKKYSSVQAPKFVNGVLDAVLRVTEIQISESQDGK